MAALVSSLASAALHCHPVSVTDAVPRSRDQSASSARIRFKRLGAVGTLPSSAYCLNQAPEGLARKLVRRSRKRVAVVRSQGVQVEAPDVEKLQAEDSVHKVLIVGAGIAGLSAAVALHSSVPWPYSRAHGILDMSPLLHGRGNPLLEETGERVGVKVHLLEQSSSIRATGTSLSLWGNAWRALEYLGVADSLREKNICASRIAFSDKSGKILRKLEFTEAPGGPHEVRGVERKLLIEALAAQLPPGSIQLNSQVRAIRREPGDRLTNVKLENGTVLSTKILLGCDGANSVVAKWMGLPPTRYVGQLGIRGVAEYPNGHEFGDTIIQYLGNGDRCGIFPFSNSKVYWSITWPSSTRGPKITDRNLVKEEALRFVQNGWPEKMNELVTNTPVESVSRAALADRWNISGVTPPLIGERMALSGDAMHPMTPSLGQGGGTAIEDGVVLAQTLGVALSEDGDDESIQKSLEEYAALRQKRTFPITVKSFVAGALFAIDFPPVVQIRNSLAIPKLVSASSILSHTLFDVGKLPTAKVNVE